TKLAPALLPGCTVVMKPASPTPLSFRIIVDAVTAAGVPAGVVNLVTGPGRMGDLMVRHPKVAKVAFTGSTPVGRHIAAAYGELLRPVTLELGGKSSAIVMEDADLEDMSAKLIRSCMRNTGQTCYISTRILAPPSRYDEVGPSLHRRSRRSITTRRINSRRVLSDFHRHVLRGITITPGIRQAVRSATPRRYPGGLAARSARPVHPPSHRPSLRAPRPWHRIPVSPRKHRHHDLRWTIGLSYLRIPGRVRTRPHTGTYQCWSGGSPSTRPYRRTTTFTDKREASYSTESLQPAGHDGGPNR